MQTDSEQSAERELERRSSAVTLSDMEIFLFPELMYSLVLANIMSPRIWLWRNDPWFNGVGKMTPSRRMARLKQFVMDHYAFNLDLDTWGLTTRERELKRFEHLIDATALARSNALFGYEGDKYYFDIDIRTHFGLDKYSGNVIPYWKTETVEAMDAFRFKPEYATGAGECVSLSALYAAALFVVADIPLRDIFLLATPLHSQDFVDVGDGVLTNNRRLVTKNMWFNGTALSAQARRALENERVTVVAHESGVIHALYEDASIAPAAYQRFEDRLRAFLKTKLTEEVLGNFIRHSTNLQKCFQVRWNVRGNDRYLAVERALEYEFGSSFRLTDSTRDRLMAEIESDQFEPRPLPSRIVLNDIERFVKENKIDIARPGDAQRLKDRFASDCLNAEIAIESLIRFCRTDPRLPDGRAKRFAPPQAPLGIEVGMGREEIVARLEALRALNSFADMAFYAYRDLNRTAPEPFVKAALERNPVSVAGCGAMDLAAVEARLAAMPDESIYDGPGRLAQPDEVWNYGRGDGAEKALLLGNILCARESDGALEIRVDQAEAVLTFGGTTRVFTSTKGLRKQTWSWPAART